MQCLLQKHSVLREGKGPLRAEMTAPHRVTDHSYSQHTYFSHIGFVLFLCKFMHVCIHFSIQTLVLSPRKQVLERQASIKKIQSTRAQSIQTNASQSLKPSNSRSGSEPWRVISFHPHFIFQWLGNHAFGQGTEVHEGDVLRLH